MDILEDVELTAYNSFGIKCNTRAYLRLHSAAQLPAALNYAKDNDLPVQILGAGSNILFTGDFPGLVLHVGISGIELQTDDDQVFVTAGAGENWHAFVTECLDKGLYGLENLALIPGTVGAAPIQNIGAYGMELAEVFSNLQAFDLLSGEIVEFDRAACKFAYRDSFFKQQAEARYLIVSVTLALSRQANLRVDYPDLQRALPAGEVTPNQVYQAVCSIRREKLPDPAELGNAGSFFKNPLVSRSRYQSLLSRYPDLPCYATEDDTVVKLPAAWLLDCLGWKGRCRGAAGVHQHHALVLVNRGGASAEDIYLLAQDMSASVLEEFGIALEPEVRFV